MKHQINEERLALFLRGDLSGVDRRAVAQHVATCVECQSTLEDLSRGHELLIGSFEDPTRLS
jgi:anti-sigma factor RsiW